MHSTVVNKPRTLPACFFSQVSTSARAKTVTKNDETAIQESEPQPSQVKVNKESLSNTSPKLNSISSTEDEQSNTRDGNLESEREEPLHDRDNDSTPELITEEGDESILNDGQISSSDVPLLDTVRDVAAPNVNSVYDHPSSPVSSSDNVSTSANEPPKKRPACLYGTSCYRRNLQHKAEFSHPGDEDHEDEEARCSSSTDADVTRNKPACWYGTRCYRKNKEHLEAFSHNFTATGRPARTTTAPVRISSDSDGSEELNDFSDSDEYEGSFIDDEETTDELQSEDDDEPEMLSDPNTSEDEDNKKRKKKTSRKNKKKKSPL